MVYEEPKKMLLYGDACRVSTDPIAKASYFFDLIQVSDIRFISINLGPQFLLAAQEASERS